MPLHPVRHWAVADTATTTADGEKLALRAWGGSSVSTSAAQAQADTRLGRMRTFAAHGFEAFCEAHDYDYGDARRLVREELIEVGPEIQLQQPELGVQWLVTRTRYGAEVLNTAHLAILDLDDRGVSVGDWLRNLGASPARRQARRLAALTAWVRDAPERGARVYRTPKGFRVLLTHRPYAVNDPELLALMRLTRTDRLYQRLCQLQECFRARLTPKPWRIGVGRAHWLPLPDGHTRSTADLAWLAQYRQASAGVSACGLYAHLGNVEIDRGLRDVVRQHDARSGALVAQPLG